MRIMAFDEKAQEILAAVSETGKSLKSLTARVTLTVGRTVQVGDLVVRNPDFARLTLRPQTGGAASHSLFDGTWLYEVEGAEYERSPAKSVGDVWPFLFGFPELDPKQLRHAGAELFQGVSCDVLLFTAENQKIQIYVTPERVVSGFTAQIGPGQRQELKLDGITLNAAVSEVFRLPTGVKPKRVGGASVTERESTLLKVGATLPPLALVTPEAKPLPLRPGKGLLLVFWSASSGPSLATLAEIEKFQRRFGGRGLQVVALTTTETNAQIQSFLKRSSLTIATARLTEKQAKPFGVGAYPTCFLTDAGGKIRYRSVGYNRMALTAALAELGLK